MGMFIGRVTLSLCIFLLILTLMNQGMDGSSPPHHPLQYHEVVHPAVEANIIILGASSAMHAINSRYLKADHLEVWNLLQNETGPSFKWCALRLRLTELWLRMWRRGFMLRRPLGGRKSYPA